VLEVNPGIFVEPQIPLKRFLARVLAPHLDGQGSGSIPPRDHFRAPDDPAPIAGGSMPAERLTTRKRQIEIERPEHWERVPHPLHRAKIYTIRDGSARFPLTLRENAWDDRETPYESTFDRARTAGRGVP
jgi:hypothetical protein